MPSPRPMAGDDQPHRSMGQRQRAYDQVDAFIQLETADRQDVVAEGPRLERSRQRWRMVQRLGGESVVFRQTGSRIPRIAEQPLRLRESFGVQPDEPIAKANVGLRVAELAVFRRAQVVNRAVLMEQ